MNAIDDVARERQEQVCRHGFDIDHDDRHRCGQLAMAACCYASLCDLYTIRRDEKSIVFRDPWPWSAVEDKRMHHDRRRRLVIAAALIVAEIERLDRAGGEP